MMMNVPPDDVQAWKQKLSQSVHRSEVLRELATRYGIRNHSIGLMLADLCEGISTEYVQYVWAWDFDKTGKGISDAELDQHLAWLLFV